MWALFHIKIGVWCTKSEATVKPGKKQIRLDSGAYEQHQHISFQSTSDFVLANEKQREIK